MTCIRSVTVGVLMTMGLATPAQAQVDFTGNWEPPFHEDYPERIPGPAVGDYVALPINAAARMGVVA